MRNTNPTQIRPSRRIATTVAWLLAGLLLWTGLALAQADDPITDDFDWDAYEPFGDVDIVYEDFDDPDLGAIVLQHSTPGDQHANFDVVGPDDYWEHFDFSDDPGEEFVLDGLQPGVYSVAATDEGLQLAHAVVRIRAGESAAVTFTMEPWDPEAFEEGAYDPTAAYGTYEGYEDAYPGYPYGAYAVGPYAAYDADDTGAIAIENVTEGVDVVVTGPNGYSSSVESGAVIENLPPGLYAIAASGEGTDTSVTTVEVRAGQELPVSATTVSIEGMN